MERIRNASDEDFATHLIGESITAIAGNTIKLASGKTLEIENASDCCAWFDGELEAIDLTDNAITSVEHVDHKSGDGCGAPQHFSIHVLSAHKLIAKVNIKGDETSGYYCHSIHLNIKAGK